MCQNICTLLSKNLDSSSETDLTSSEVDGCHDNMDDGTTGYLDICSQFCCIKPVRSRTVSICDRGEQNSYFKPKLDVFLNLTNWFLGLKHKQSLSVK